MTIKPHPPCQEATVILHEISRLIRKRLEERIVDLGLSEAQWRVIGFLSIGAGMSQTELAELLGMQKVPLGEILDRLGKKQLVYRKESPQDRRSKLVFLTNNARQLAESIRERFRTLRQNWQQSIGEAHWKLLQENLYIMADELCPLTTQQTLYSSSRQDASHLIGIIVRSIRRQFDLCSHQSGVTWSHWLIVNAVTSNPGINQRELADTLAINKVPLGKLLDRLQQNGWLRREQDQQDRRIKRLFINLDAQSLQRSQQVFHDYNKQCLTKIPQTKQSDFINTLIQWHECLIQQADAESTQLR